MARKRMLSNELWRDKKVIKLSSNALILWIAIITIADDEGLFEYDAESWFYELARRDMTPEKINKSMDEIKSLQMVVMYGDSYGFIPSWYKHQSLSHPTATKLQRPSREILENYPEYVASWQKTFTSYQKDANGDRVQIIPEYPFCNSVGSNSENFQNIPETSGNFRKLPGSIDKVSIDKVSIVQSSFNKEAQASPSPTPEKLPHGEFGNVKLTDQEYRKLTDRYKKQDVDRVIETMGAWMKSKGKVYKDHYAALLNWIKKDGVQERGQIYRAPEADEGLASPDEIAEALARLPIKRFA